MKKLKLFSLFGLGALFTFGLLFGTIKNSAPLALYAEDSSSEPISSSNPSSSSSVDDPVDDPVDDEEEFECKVILSAVQHGEIKADKLEGHVGDTVILTAEADIFYLVKSCSVNGTALVESEEKTGEFSFALVKGENKVSVVFEIDQELFGELSGMVNQAVEGDWTSLFSLRNLIAIITFLLNGGFLIAIARYYVKDKKLAKKIESTIEKVIEKLLPQALRDTILNFLTGLITPYFANIETSIEDIQESIVVFCRCLALAQENTPEARIAITKELSSLKNSDKATISSIENKINKFIKEEGDKMTEVLQKIKEMKIENQQIVLGESEAKEEASEQIKPVDNGTQI